MSIHILSYKKAIARNKRKYFNDKREKCTNILPLDDDDIHDDDMEVSEMQYC